jgi:hypothetical protein
LIRNFYKEEFFMNRLICPFVIALAMLSSSANGQEVDAESTAGADAVPANAIKLESNSLDLFVDILVVNDIGGRIDGVYEDANTALLSAVAHDARTILADDAVVSDVKLANGMVIGDQIKLVNAKAGKSTGDTFVAHTTSDSIDSLAPAESMAFFRDLINNPAIAPKYSALSGRDRGQRHPANFALPLPGAGLGGSSRYLLFVQAAARHVPVGKSIGLGVLVGIMPVSFGSVNVALIDKQSSRVLWAMQRPIRDINQIQLVAIKLVRSLDKTLLFNSHVTAENVATNPQEAVGQSVPPKYRSIRDAKLALNAGSIDRAEYDRVAAELESQYRQVLDGLKKKELSGEISDAALEILSAKAELEYTGASAG